MSLEHPSNLDGDVQQQPVDLDRDAIMPLSIAQNLRSRSSKISWASSRASQ
jgi:hypothetical protein